MHSVAFFLEDVAVPDLNEIGFGVLARVAALEIPAASAVPVVSPRIVDVQMMEGLRFRTFDLAPCHFVLEESLTVRVRPPYLLQEIALCKPFAFVREAVLKKRSTSRLTTYFERMMI